MMRALLFHFVFTLLLVKSNYCFSAPQYQDSGSIRTNVSYYSNNYLLKGWLFKPSRSENKKLPAIVMAPGFSGIKECNYQSYAENFSKAGFAVLLFDYPNFGESEGINRQEADPSLQVQAYRDGISYLAALEDVDPKRIGLWGGSYSGGHVIVAGALDKRVKCIVAMTPFISGSFYVKNMPSKTISFLTQQFNADRLSRVQGGKPALIPVVSGDPNKFSAITGANAVRFVESFRSNAPDYKNEVTLKSLEMQLEYEPGSFVTTIDTIPKLFIVAKNDEMIPESLIRETYNKASNPKKLIYLEGNHFSPYMEKLNEASDIAIEWFKAKL